LNCRNHPTQKGHFHCPECDAFYCPECISKRQIQEIIGMEIYHYCPKCNVLASTVSVGSLVTPFWQQLNYFFTYPLQLQPLLFILFFGFFGLAADFAFWGQVIFYGALVKYSYLVLTNTAHARLTPPDIESDLFTSGYGALFQQAVLYLCLIFSSLWILAKLGQVVGLIYILTCLLLLPLMIIALVAMGSLLHALNPLVLYSIGTRIGSKYYLLYLFLVIIGGAPAALVHFGAEYINVFVLKYLSKVATVYYTIMAYNLMGYVLLQYSSEIGYEVNYDDFERSQRKKVTKKSVSKNPRDQLLEKVSNMVRDGRLDTAMELILQETDGEFKDYLLAERYFKLLKAAKQNEDLLTHGALVLDMAVKRNNKKNTVDVYKDCLEVDKNFLPSSESLLKTVDWVVQLGDAKLGLNTLLRYTKSYKDDPLLYEVYLKIAQIFKEKMNDTNKAKKIIRYIVKKYPQHELQPQAKLYWQILNRQRAAGR